MSPIVKRYRTQRLFDYAIAAPAFVLGSLPLLFGITATYLTIGRPVIFTQQRYGLNGRPFTAYKIRSMSSERDAAGRLLPDEKRVTKTGEILRRTAIDELPQLWNVARGDMSIVGPRPMPMEIDIPGFGQRYAVRPGLASPPKVWSRRNSSAAEKLECDLRYIRTRGLWQDCKILLKSIKIAVTGNNDRSLRAELRQSSIEEGPAVR